MRSALAQEFALYRCLGRWLTRQPDVPPGAKAIGYSQLVAPVLWLWIFASGTEAVVVEVVLRTIDAAWADAIRLPFLIVGIWGVIWMLGLMASYRVKPHLLTDDMLVVRNSARTWVEVPLPCVETIRAVGHELPGGLKSLRHEDGLLLVGVNGQTNLELVLEESTILKTSKGELAAEKVGLWVDEPRIAVAQLR